MSPHTTTSPSGRAQKKPYTMLKPSSTLQRGNDRYQGICVDLMDKLAEIHGFNYTLVVNPEGTAGKPDKNGTWTGMIGDLLRQVSSDYCRDLVGQEAGIPTRVRYALGVVITLGRWMM